MKVKIGNQTFDSADVPIAILYTEVERTNMTKVPPKTGDDHHLYVRWPTDIPLQVLSAWVREAVPEMDLTKLDKFLFNNTKPQA